MLKIKVINEFTITSRWQTTMSWMLEYKYNSSIIEWMFCVRWVIFGTLNRNLSISKFQLEWFHFHNSLDNQMIRFFIRSCWIYCRKGQNVKRNFSHCRTKPLKRWNEYNYAEDFGAFTRINPSSEGNRKKASVFKMLT